MMWQLETPDHEIILLRNSIFALIFQISLKKEI
jgi:hypothetical protein